VTRLYALPRADPNDQSPGDGARPIVGGIFARKPHGVIRWWAADGDVVVAVERFAPLLRGPFWRFESWFHELVGRRYLARVGNRSR
jgi:hypothetical protein